MWRGVRLLSLMAAAVVASGLAAAAGGAAGSPKNLVADGSFEQPLVGTGYKLYSTGATFNGWHVVGAAGNVAPISGAFVQNGIHFGAAVGKQWLDLTGLSNSATGVAQTVRTKAGRAYRLSFAVGNVVDSGGTFGSSSTVVVLVNGHKVLSATNRGGGSTQAWKRFTVAVKATRAATTIEFLNGDPPTESSNGLDGVSLVART